MMTGFKTGLTAITLIGAMLSFPQGVNATFSAPHEAALSVSADALEARKAYQARRADELHRLQTGLERSDNALLTVVAALKASCDSSCANAL